MKLSLLSSSMLRSPRAFRVSTGHCCTRQLNTAFFRTGSGPGRHMSVQASASTAMSEVQAHQEQPAADDPIVQWVVLRRDLWTDIGWPLGPVIAQACHASSAAMFTHLDDPVTQQYIAQDNIDHMHKVVLEVKSEQQLVNLSKKLEQEGILHKLWIEQPENYPTCLATKPYQKSQAAALFKKLQLCKAALAK